MVMTYAPSDSWWILRDHTKCVEHVPHVIGRSAEGQVVESHVAAGSLEQHALTHSSFNSA